MAQPNLFAPPTLTPSIFGGPKTAGIDMPLSPRVKPKGVAPTKGSYQYSRHLAEEAALRQGMDPKDFVRNLSYISGLNPTARKRGRGVAGLQAAASANVNPWDTSQSYDYMAKILAGLELLKARRP